MVLMTSSRSRLLAALRGRGITVEAIAGRLKVTPASALTEADRRAIQQHRHSLLVEIVNPPLDSGLCPHCKESPSLCPPYGWCRGCAAATWAEVAAR